MPVFVSRYANFSDLEELVAIFRDEGVVAQQGHYNDEEPIPGPHIMVSSRNTRKSYDFIKRSDGSYVVRVHTLENL